MKEKKKVFSCADSILFALLIAIGIGITLWIYLPQRSTGNHVIVKQNGVEIMTLPLNKDTTQTITSDNGGTNTFHIKDNSVTMTESNCKDNTCVHTGSISQTKESIVCLPHRLVIEVISADSQDKSPDAIIH